MTESFAITPRLVHASFSFEKFAVAVFRERMIQHATVYFGIMAFLSTLPRQTSRVVRWIISYVQEKQPTFCFCFWSVGRSTNVLESLQARTQSWTEQSWISMAEGGNKSMVTTRNMYKLLTLTFRRSTEESLCSVNFWGNIWTSTDYLTVTWFPRTRFCLAVSNCSSCKRNIFFTSPWGQLFGVQDQGRRTGSR